MVNPAGIVSAAVWVSAFARAVVAEATPAEEIAVATTTVETGVETCPEAACCPAPLISTVWVRPPACATLKVAGGVSNVPSLVCPGGWQL